MIVIVLNISQTQDQKVTACEKLKILNPKHKILRDGLIFFPLVNDLSISRKMPSQVYILRNY